MLIVSLRRYKYLSLIDISILLSWFYLYFRPLLHFRCGVESLYYDNNSLYIQGVLLGVTLSLLFQAGALLLSPLKVDVSKSCLSSLGLARRPMLSLLKIANLSVYCLVVCAMSLVLVGPRLFLRLGSSEGALSVVSGLMGSVSFGLINYSTSYSVFALAYLVSLKLRPTRLFVVGLIVLMIFNYFIGKRSSLLQPFLQYLSVLSFCSPLLPNISARILNSLLRLRVSFLQLSSLTAIVLLSCLFFQSVFRGALDFADVRSLCLVSEAGGQEYDTSWPGILLLSQTNLHLLDLPSAFVGQFIPHSVRLSLSTSFLSVTDKFNLAFNPSAYSLLKFGISPTREQFYVFYLSLGSLLFMPFLGFYARKLEVFLFSNAYRSIPRYLLIYSLMSLPLCAFDFEFKYTLAAASLSYLFYLFVSSVRMALVARF
jgi:hypothetical protein